MAKKKKVEAKTTGKLSVSHPKVFYTCNDCGETTLREHLIEYNDKLQCPHCSSFMSGEPTFKSFKEYLDFVAPIRLY